MSRLSDELIMQQVQDGDLDQMAILFERYQRKIYNFFIKMCHDRDVSEDLAQTTFYRMVKYRMSYKTEFPFRGWLYQIARNVFNSHYHKSKVLISDYDDAEELADTSESPTQQQQDELLHKALQQLPEDKRQLLVLSKFQGLKYEEIAQITDMSVASIKVNVHPGY